MSANKEDEYFSGTSLDVAEQSSNPRATGPLAPGSQNGTPPLGKVNADSGNGKPPASVNRNRTKSKEVTGSTRTLMRTHSAPPDEHAGIFEVGSNGVRSNQFQSFSGQPVNMIDPASNSELQTSSNLPQPYSSTSTHQATHTPSSDERGNGGAASSTQQQYTPTPVPTTNYPPSSKNPSPQQQPLSPQQQPFSSSSSMHQHGGVTGIQHQQPQMRQQKSSPQSSRTSDSRGYMDPTASYDPTGGNRGGANVPMQGQQRMVPVPVNKMMSQHQQPHVHNAQYTQTQTQQPFQYQQQQVYHVQQHPQMIGINQQMQQQGGVPQLGHTPQFQSQAFLHYPQTAGNVQPFPVSNQQQQGMRPGINTTGGLVIGQQGANNSVSNGVNVVTNSKVSGSPGGNGGTSPQPTLGGTGQTPQVPVMSLTHSPHMMPQSGGMVSVSGLNPLPPSQGIVQQQPGGGGVITYGSGVGVGMGNMGNMVGYQMTHGQQQPQMRGGTQIYTQPTQRGGQMTAPYAVSAGMGMTTQHQQQHQQQQQMQMQQHQMQPSPAINIPVVKEKKKLVLKDKNGNIIDMTQLAKKDNTPTTTSTSSAAATVQKSDSSPSSSSSSSGSKGNTQQPPPLPAPSGSSRSGVEQQSLEKQSPKIVPTPSPVVEKVEDQIEQVQKSVEGLSISKGAAVSGSGDSSDGNNSKTIKTTSVAPVKETPPLFGSSGVPVSETSSSTTTTSSSPAVQVKGVLEIYDPLLEKMKAEKEKEKEGSESKVEVVSEKKVATPPLPVSDKTEVEKTSLKSDSSIATRSSTGRNDRNNRNESEKTNGNLNISSPSLKEIPDVIPVPKASMSPGGVLDKRSKKNKLKEMLAQADASSKTTEGTMLDAYVSGTKQKDEVQSKKVSTPPPPVNDPAPNTTSDSNEVEDSWETQATKLEDEVAAAEKEKEQQKEEEKEKPSPPVPAKRSLRPGGGVEKKSGGSATKQNVIRYVFKKSEIMKLKPSIDRLERPAECAIYINIVTSGGDSGGGGRQQGGNWKGGQGGHYNQGGGGMMQQQMMYQQQMSQHNLPQGGHGLASGGDAGWQRGQQQPPSQNHGGGRRNRGPVPAMVKKVITDPVEVLTREVTDILNKITPQTFQKLTHNLSEIQVHDSRMLATLVRLIFDKAITEPSYAMLYADMCQTLDSANKYVNFFNVVFNKDTNQYFWVKDLEYTNELAGPYSSCDECTNAMLADVPPPLSEVTHAVALHSIQLVKGTLVSIIKSVDREEYFVSFIPLVDVDESMKSPQLFATEEAAYKSGLKRNSFQKILVTICQEEYFSSTSNQGIYGEPKIRREELLEKKNTMDADEYEVLAEELSMFEMAVKKRKMGNIRFIGELCKRKMIRTNTMHHCIAALLVVEDGEKVDGGNVELVCKLLTSVGQKLEQEATTSAEMDVLDSYFAKLIQLRSSKSLFSRIRFSIDEVVELRRNKWVARVEQDGPATLEEIRKRAAEDEERKAIAQQQLHAGHHHYGGKGGKGGGRGSGDVRNVGRGGHQSSSNTGRNSSGGGKGNKGGFDSGDRRNSGGGGSGKGNRSNDNGRHQQQAERQPPQSIQTKEKTMSPDKMKKRTATIVNEYVSSSNEQEAHECLAELPPQACGYLVANLLDKYVTTIKEAERDTLLKLCAVVMPQLQAASTHVESAIKTYENLEFLADFTMDVKMAPELTGEILKVLISGRACRRDFLDRVMSDLRKTNKDDEYGVPDEQFQAIHDRLRSKL